MCEQTLQETVHGGCSPPIFIRVTKSRNYIISPNSIILPCVIVYAMVNGVRSKFGDMLLLLGVLKDILLRHCQKL